MSSFVIAGLGLVLACYIFLRIVFFMLKNIVSVLVIMGFLLIFGMGWLGTHTIPPVNTTAVSTENGQ